ncbi:FecR family protein [Tistrella mobilis]|uniref:Anti-FecI sigma factor, FecR n=1 Tax=Tistrella mobilis (strain KA081020-065) TaxID=1110502 RepID=I3TT92_TISMK|nr:FecR domain-containing protein [Tistrella mobilis]AFK55980.1 anti-FecI sigma factor, FecR [Tistrella mobilis KA081020-065]
MAAMIDEDDRAAAMRWFLLLNEEPVAAEDRAAFARWLAGGEGRVAAYARAEELWDRFGAVKPAWQRMQTRRRVGRRAVLTGGVALMAGAAASQLVAPGRLLADETTGTGERRQLVLADGSRVELGGRSALSTRLDGSRRLVTLEAGEAWFRPAADPRPFVLRTGQGLMTATAGAAFDVKRRGGVTIAAALEGGLRLHPAAGAPVDLAAGHRSAFDDRAAGAPRPCRAQEVLAWRRDRIVFEDETLAAVVEDLDRYRPGRILLGGDRVAGLKVTAVFDLTRPDQALDILAETLDLRIRRLAGLALVTRAG